MKIYGCDFSGAKDPNGKIYVVCGELEHKTFTFTEVLECEDRLDLLYKIKNSAAPWGLDFPFSIPLGHLSVHYQASWKDFLEDAYSDTREQFKTKFGKVHSGKNNAVDCRVTDIVVDAKSPIATTPISMNGMLFGGRKLLLNILDSASIYPFTKRDAGAARLYEVYPSNGWSLLGLNREGPQDIEHLSTAFKERIDPDFHIELDSSLIPLEKSGKKAGKPIQHAADALMACLTLGYCLLKYKIDEEWDHQPSFVSNEEWSMRRQEGLIVRM
ncbi:hypothetical protein BBD42_30090 [Paenibacillus sp. BIHB 4019]|uniref:DUF429 domain-containing protein n=1 Tax=Paenibacillus sp. BIHB 4019 TaxID=1870819 RepID=A0A1B2DRC3_9BACL|nr:hypothetical protein [Paenibacillus sp. BIHB 4019]ANY70273.1 hypothetical protein BBD42_30090 [Paenibacillus sp. BIHB 4019]